ncbi:MAG TPA: phosphatidate cytidylyltransferase [Pirellulales bacterium]|jgi:phosphatidate cytidylyltransferase
MTARERLFDPSRAFEHPVTVGIVAAVAIALIVATVLIRVLKTKQKINDATYRELISRTRSWYVLVVLMLAPILLGAAWVCGFFLLLSVFCFREFARATELSSSKTAMISVYVAIAIVYFAVLDNWMGLFTTSWALGIALIAVAGLLPDHPQGYLHRVALAVVGFALFGISLGHLAFISNDELFRPILLWLLVCTELNDVFAYLSGKKFGRRKLAPNTSPNKTVAGAVGAVLLTTTLAAVLGGFVFRGTALERWPHLITMGILISVLGQCGDLVLSSIKRDIGVKDMAAVIPGHGGLLDRFDSLLIVAPCLFHYINYFKANGVGLDQPARIITSALAGG